MQNSDKLNTWLKHFAQLSLVMLYHWNLLKQIIFSSRTQPTPYSADYLDILLTAICGEE